MVDYGLDVGLGLLKQRLSPDFGKRGKLMQRRSRDHVIHLVNSFHQRGIHFKTLNLGFDTTTPAGKFMFSIFASLAE